MSKLILYDEMEERKQLVTVAAKYFPDGLVEEWVVDDDGDEIAMLRSYHNPRKDNKPPTVKLGEL
jgi:hypothetical protein